ncbi:MAG: ribosomal-processing cysteine protease Prp [Clostridia bacterium]|nr:ribosomal-processing cysteine protease Prp [Clostridia bacterium]
MINVEFLINKHGAFLGFQISGHSAYDECGKDIVCAAVSSAAFMAVNTITDILKVDAEAMVNKSGNMFFKVKREDLSHCKDILIGFKLHMISLEEIYPKNITVNYLEV